MAEIKVSAEKLRALETAIFEKKGFSKEGAEMVANSLVEADLRGVSSHGAIRVPVYLSRLDHNVVFPDKEFDVCVDNGAMAIVDGHDSFGQISGTKAMQLAIEKAKKFGVSCVGVRNSHHYGTAAYYAMMAADQNMIAMSTTNTNPLIPPVGGLQKKVGNNPICFAIPAGKHRNMVLDMACSTVAQGKLQLAAKKGTPIPQGWATDANGFPTTDPQEAMKGFLTAVGGPKGFGMALIMDLLCGPLVGAACGAQVTGLTNCFERPQNCGHFFIVIDISKFCDVDEFKKQVDDYIDYIKDCPTNETVNGIYMPGEIEYNLYDERIQNGIPLPETIINDLKKVCADLELDFDKYME